MTIEAENRKIKIKLRDSFMQKIDLFVEHWLFDYVLCFSNIM